jgi:hypothetical protein
MQDQSSLIIELRTGRNGNLHKRLEAGHQLLPMVAAGKGEFAIIFASGVIKWQNFQKSNAHQPRLPHLEAVIM